MDLLVLYRCDGWKNWSSARVEGIFDNEDILKEKIWRKFLDDELY